MSLPLITKYRPINFNEVIGNETCIGKLQAAVNSDSRPHAYLFTGSSGIGKTTLARIIASEIKASVLEIDAASNSGVEDMRLLVEASGFQPISTHATRLYIIDECHTLTKNAWQALLKLLEEPPAYLFIALCTTEISKVPETIKTRCYSVPLKPLKPKEMEELISMVCELEEWTVKPDVFQAILQASTGQPRKALSILQAGHSITTREELGKVVAEVESENSAAAELCRLLLKTDKPLWSLVAPLLQRIEEDDDEEAISIATRYMSKAMTSPQENIARRAWTILDALTYPQSVNSKKSQLSAAVGRIVWSN